MNITTTKLRTEST